MRAVIVDDEGPARRVVRQYLDDFPGIAVAAACKSGREAVEAICRERPGLVLLDVQMPELDGFEVLRHVREALPPKALPRVVFSTAYDEHALRAFEVGAVDYLLKPYERERFAEAVRRALGRTGYREELRDVLDAAPQRTPDESYPEHLFVERAGEIVPVETEDLRWVEAAGDYAKLHLTGGDTYLSSEGISALEKRLDPRRFARVHRSTLVALRALRRLERTGSGGFVATLDDGTQVRVSRTYAGKIKKLML